MVAMATDASVSLSPSGEVIAGFRGGHKAISNANTETQDGHLRVVVNLYCQFG